jgi:uncharacterized protein
VPTLDQASQWYPHDDPVHGFDHVRRVYHLARYLALQEGADLEVVSAAALLHDIDSGAPPPQAETDLRNNHQHAAADFAAQILTGEGWSVENIAAVQHAIRAHRFRDDRERPQTSEARVLFDADKLDAIGAIGVARALAYAVQAGTPAYATPSAQFRQTGLLAPGETHSAYHEYLFKLRLLRERLFTATARQLAENRHRLMAEFFEQLAEEMQFTGREPLNLPGT